MPEQNQTGSNSSPSPRNKPRRIFKITIISLSAIVAVLFVGSLILYTYNNLSLMDNETFARKIDFAIENGRFWVECHRYEILAKKNIALIRMLQDINTIHPDRTYSGIVNSFMARPSRPDCWKRLIDPNHPITSLDLNKTIKQEYIDNKWTLYAIAPEDANITPQQLRLFDSEHWQGRQLTHQLWALIHLRRAQGPNDELDALIEHLCNRITSSLRFDIAVVDHYIQKVAFVLKARFGQKIRRRWVERIIANQQPEGGWNDKWFIFTSNRRPVLNFSQPSSNQHATVQALWLLYQVKYRYAEHFGLPH